MLSPDLYPIHTTSSCTRKQHCANHAKHNICSSSCPHSYRRLSLFKPRPYPRWRLSLFLPAFFLSPAPRAFPLARPPSLAPSIAYAVSLVRAPSFARAQTFLLTSVYSTLQRLCSSHLRPFSWRYLFSGLHPPFFLSLHFLMP